MVGLHPMAGVLVRRGEFGFKYTQGNHVRMEAEVGPLRNAGNRHARREAGPGSPSEPPEGTHPAESGVCTFGLQN